MTTSRMNNWLRLFVVCTTAFVASGTFAGNGLPIEYQEVEYLQSTGTQYIVHSGYTLNAKTSRIEFRYYVASTDYKNVNYREIFGVTSGVNFYLNYNTGGALRANLRSGSTTPNFGTSAYGDLEFVVTRTAERTFDWTMTKSGTSTTKTHEISKFPTSDFGIFCDSGATPYPSSIKLYYFRVYENDGSGERLVRNYIPCYRRADGVAGLCDASGNNENIFLPNGSGIADVDFIKGPEVYEKNRIAITENLDDVPDNAGYSIALGGSDLTPGVETTASVSNSRLSNASGTFVWNLLGWKMTTITHPDAGESETIVTQSSAGNHDACTFTPAANDERYLEWLWEKTEVTNEFMIRDADGELQPTVYSDLAAAVNAATNDCTIELQRNCTFDSAITIANIHLTIKSADGHHYSLTRASSAAGFVIETTSDVRHAPDSDWGGTSSATTDTLDNGFGCYPLSYNGYELTRLCVTNLVIDGGSGDGVAGGTLVLLNGGVQSSYSRLYNFCGFKMEAESEIQNFTTVSDYMITYKSDAQYQMVRLHPGAKIHDVTGDKGVLTFPTANNIYTFGLFMNGAEIYNCTSHTGPILQVGLRRSLWNRVRFIDCAITNNLCGSADYGTVYLRGDPTVGKDGDNHSVLNVSGDVIIADNSLFSDHTAPANARLSATGKVDIHGALGPNAMIGLQRVSLVAPAVGDDLGFATYTASDANVKAIYCDANPKFVAKIVNGRVVWKKPMPFVIIIK